MTTKMLDLDAIQEPVKLIFKFKGKEHAMKELTVVDYAANLQAIEKLGLGASQNEELQTMMDMILRSFPSLTQADLNGLTMAQLQAINDFAQSGGAANATTVPAEGDQGNAPAGK